MRLEVNGTSYGDFTGITVTNRLDTLCKTFTFDAVKTGTTPLPFRGGEACRIFDEEDLLLTGYIERLDVNYSSTGHQISLSGRDKTGDIVDSSLRAVGDFKPPLSLKRCIELAISDIGGAITVFDNASPDIFKTASDLVAPEPGQNAFEFIEKLARKRQVLLTSNGYGQVVITRAATTRSGGALQNIIGADDNNIKTSSSSYDSTGRYRNYTFVSALNGISGAQAGAISASDMVSQEGAATDTGVRAGRQMILQSESSLSSGNNQERATWEADLRKARGRLYSVVVQGFRVEEGGDLWAPNTLVRVIDNFAGISGDMLINEVTFNFDVNQGSTTALTLVPPNAYTLQLSEPAAQEIGSGLI